MHKYTYIYSIFVHLETCRTMNGRFIRGFLDCNDIRVISFSRANIEQTSTLKINMAKYRTGCHAAIQTTLPIILLWVFSSCAEKLRGRSESIKFHAANHTDTMDPASFPLVARGQEELHYIGESLCQQSLPGTCEITISQVPGQWNQIRWNSFHMSGENVHISHIQSQQSGRSARSQQRTGTAGRIGWQWWCWWWWRSGWTSWSCIIAVTQHKLCLVKLIIQFVSLCR